MKKKIVIIFLILLTLGLAGASIYIALQVTEEQAPEDSGASGANACQRTENGNCFTLSIKTNEGQTSCDYTIRRFVGTSCPTNSEQSGSDETGTLTGTETFTVCTQGNSGANSCLQVDDLNSDGGVCACSGDSEEEEDKNVCGESCDSDSDCVSESAAGDPVECRNGTCQLPTSICPNGFTEDGANCACTYENTCGERCGDGYGECGDDERCTYANGPDCDPHGIRYCVPKSDLLNGYEKHTCTSGDEFGTYVEKPDGTSNITQAQATAICDALTPGECNDLCGADAGGKQCDTGLTCTNNTASGNYRCRLTSNLSSGTCEQTDGECNDLCGSDANGRACASGLSCVTANNGSKRCRLPSNPNSNTCSTNVTAECNDLCGSSAGGATCSSGLSCTLLATGNRRCRLAANPTHAGCIIRSECNESCDNVTTFCRTGQGETCISGVCRLTSNPDSTTCEPVTGEPAFSVTKSATPVCLSTSDDLVLSYTITVENFGDVSGVVDEIVDTYDPQIDSLGFVISAITPSYGTQGNGKITWIGSEAQRTFAAGESKTYTYSVTIPKLEIDGITSQDLANTVSVQYDTESTQDNVVTFDLVVDTDCSVLPTTGILDNDSKFLRIALLSIVLAIVFYKFNLTETIIRKVKYKFAIGNNGVYQDKILVNINKKKKD